MNFFKKRQEVLIQQYSDTRYMLIDNVKGIDTKVDIFVNNRGNLTPIKTGFKTVVPDDNGNGFKPTLTIGTRNKFWTNKNELLLRSIRDYKEINGY